MKTKILALSALGILLLSLSLGLTTASTLQWPNLPTSAVQINVKYGTIYTTDTYFATTLSNVPAGYDVDNGIYAGWCVDRSELMERHIDHNVVLYSSLAPPSGLSGEEWGAINYILNHKQGSRTDVQHAIWSITNDYEVSGVALDMVNAAKANLNYNPLTMGGSVLAIICYDSIPDNNVQNSVIEVKIPTKPGLSPGFWKHNIAVALGINPGSYSSPYSGAPKLTFEDLTNYLADTTFSSLQEAYDALNAKGKGSDITRLYACNQFNSAAGFLPYSS